METQSLPAGESRTPLSGAPASSSPASTADSESAPGPPEKATELRLVNAEDIAGAILGRAPAVIAKPTDADRMLTPEQARLFALHAMVNARWEYADDPELSPLKGAMVLASGWQEFHADLMKELDAINRMHPALIGRENWEPVCRAVWRRLKRRLFAWSSTTMGRPMTPRQVIDAYERYYQKQRKPTLTDAKFTIEDGGERVGQDTGWASSGLVREGTIEDFVRDIRDEDGKLRAGRDLDEGLEAEKRGE